MKIDAKEFIDNAAAWLPGIEMAAKLTGRKILASVAAILRRAVENPSAKEKIIEWLRWTKVFTGENANLSEPILPAEFAGLLEEATEFRDACNCCDGENDCCSDPT